MTKYLLVFALMLPVFHGEQAEAGRSRYGGMRCYLIRGEIESMFVHTYQFMTSDAADFLIESGLRLDRKPTGDCERFLGWNEGG